jgi:hypothetical protein
MPSSTSNSDSGALIHVKRLALVCVALLITSEICANYMLKRYSLTYRRISNEYRAALRTRPSKSGEPTSVLMLGNSLLLQGVDVEKLRRQTSSSLRVYPLFLEGTAYYDWSYGMRRLFRQGARPEAVVLGLDPNSFIQSSVREEYSPLFFFDLQDVWGVASDTGLDRTATSNLLLAHASVFWDTRTVIRTQILRHLVPHFEDLFSLIKPKGSIPLDAEFEATMISRLQSLHRLCNEHGAKLIILIPPTPSSENDARLMAITSQKLGIQALLPVDPATLSRKFYESDSIHLNSKGEALFTDALGKVLPGIVARETRKTLVSPY